MNRQVFVVSLVSWLLMTVVSPASDSQAMQQAATLAGPRADALAPLPSGDQVIRRMLDRYAARAAATNAPVWAYDKRMVTEKLDGDDKVEQRTEKQYRVQIIKGVPLSKLVKVEGRDLTDAELKKENQHEAGFQKQLSGRDPKKAVKEGEALINKDLVDRFQYKTLRREAVFGRPTVVVSFWAKPGKDDGSVQGRVLSRLAGTLWVDEATADVARLEVHLTQGFSMGVLGILGSVKECGMELVSRPMTDGTWLPDKTTLLVSARMFLSSIRFRMEETSSNFTLEPPNGIIAGN
jgi:hypothetical protein